MKPRKISGLEWWWMRLVARHTYMVGVSCVKDSNATMQYPVEARSLFRWVAVRKARELSLRAPSSFIYLFPRPVDRCGEIVVFQRGVCVS